MNDVSANELKREAMSTFNHVLVCLLLAVILLIFGCKKDGGPTDPASGNPHWAHLAGPVITTNCFLSNGDTLFAGTVSGIYVSTDTGTTWRSMGSGEMATAPVFSILQSNGKLFAGTGIRKGLYASTDNAASWQLTSSGLPNSFPISLFQKDNFLFVGLSDSGVYRSGDTGTSWQSANAGAILRTADVRAFALSNNKLFVATFGSGVFASSNNGGSWSGVGISNGLTLSLLARGETLFAGTVDGGLRSTNGGQSWAVATAGMPSDNNRVTSLLDIGVYWFAGADSGIYRSSNAGAEWTSVGEGLPHPPLVNAIAMHKGYVFIATAADGIWRSKLVNLTRQIEM